MTSKDHFLPFVISLNNPWRVPPGGGKRKIGFEICNVPTLYILYTLSLFQVSNFQERPSSWPISWFFLLCHRKSQFVIDYNIIIGGRSQARWDSWPFQTHAHARTRRVVRVCVKFIDDPTDGGDFAHSQPTLPNCSLWISTEPTTSIGRIIKSSRI